jgi:hypothetical protein
MQQLSHSCSHVAAGDESLHKVILVVELVDLQVM